MFVCVNMDTDDTAYRLDGSAHPRLAVPHASGESSGSTSHHSYREVGLHTPPAVPDSVSFQDLNSDPHTQQATHHRGLRQPYKRDFLNPTLKKKTMHLPSNPPMLKKKKPLSKM